MYKTFKIFEEKINLKFKKDNLCNLKENKAAFMFRKN